MTEKPPPYGHQEPGFVQPPGQQQPYGQQQYAPPMAGYPPPAPGAPIQQQPGAPVIVAAAPINFGPDPARIDCPHCRQTIQTTTKSDTSAMGWLLGIGLCLIGCWPCAFIPCCCVDSLKQVTHECPRPECKAFLGRYNGGGL